MRWHVLDLLRIARASLGLKDRDLAVLRGLLSLLPANCWAQQMVVFASNRALAERCDGIEERTLRRRIARLADIGIVARKQSPNGKRYQIRDETGVSLLAFGIDLSPLPLWLERLEHLAAEARAEALRVRALKALLRHRLYDDADFARSEPGREAQRMLRRKLRSCELRAFLDALESNDPSEVLQETAQEMSVRSSQIVRHIHNPEKENEESSDAAFVPPNAGKQRRSVLASEARKHPDISLDECLDAAPAVCDLALERPKSWRDAAQLATVLAPAVGLEESTLKKAWQELGEFGVTLAVMGLVQAFERVRDPNAYLLSVCRKGKLSVVECLRMFRSLTRPRGRAGAVA